MAIFADYGAVSFCLVSSNSRHIAERKTPCRNRKIAAAKILWIGSTVDNEDSDRRQDLQLAWHIWCDDNGHVSGSITDFGKKLRAAISRINDQQRRVGGSRDRWYVGVGLTSEVRTDIDNRRLGA